MIFASNNLLRVPDQNIKNQEKLTLEKMVNLLIILFLLITNLHSLKMLLLTNELVKKAEINILSARIQKGLGSRLKHHG